MSKHIFMALALSAMFMTANAQDQQGFQNQQRQKPTITPEQRAERSAARIAGQLMLNDADAEIFKGVYKNYQLELSEANQKFKKEPKKMEQGEKPQRKQRTDVFPSQFRRGDCDPDRNQRCVGPGLQELGVFHKKNLLLSFQEHPSRASLCTRRQSEPLKTL